MRTEYETFATAHILENGTYSTRVLVQLTHNNAQKHHKAALATAMAALEWPETQCVEVATRQTSWNVEHNYDPYAMDRCSARKPGDSRWMHTDF